MKAEWSSTFSDSLAERWDDYVDCRRRVALEGAFLRRIMRGRSSLRVLDAGAALGCEAAFLAKRGCDVVANEIDSRLALRARSLFDELRLKVDLTSVDWRDLRVAFREESFDLALLLGNSLGLLSAAHDRRLAVMNLFALLRPGGLLVIDQRNYEYMFSKRAEVLRGHFRYSSRVMYCEKAILGRPTVIERGRVRITCVDKYSGRPLGHFDVYPFRKGELCALLVECGFTDISTYYDFREHPKDHWDFETLVARKPL